MVALLPRTTAATWWSNDASRERRCGATGSVTVTFTATDDCDNASSTTATFTIEDTTNPDLTAASDQTVECDGMGNMDALNSWLDNNGSATASDVQRGDLEQRLRRRRRLPNLFQRR